MARYYYAELLTPTETPYEVRISGPVPDFIHTLDLYRFDTRKARDAFVSASPGAIAITSRNAWANHREQLQTWSAEKWKI